MSIIPARTKPAFFYSPGFLDYDLGPSHPLKPIRIRTTYDLLTSCGAFEPDGWLEEREVVPAPLDAVLEAHSREYVDALVRFDDGHWRPEAAGFGLGTGDTPLFPGMWTASLIYAGATLGGADFVAETGGRAVNLSGGLHHAHRDRAAGFCILNDCVMGIQRLLKTFDRVLYLDIDAHHGDGVQEAFWTSDRVVTISIHESGVSLYPGGGFPEELGEGAGKGYCINAPLRAESGDDDFLVVFREIVPRAIERFRPNAIVTQMGADAHYSDPLTHLRLTTTAYEEVTRYVDGTGLPWLALGGGGYNIRSVPRIWTLVCALMAGRELPDDVPALENTTNDIRILRDHARPHLENADRSRRTAQETVRALKVLWGRLAPE